MGTDPMDRPVSLAIVEDHSVIIDGVRSWIAEAPGVRVSVVTGSPDTLLSGPGRTCDVVVLDLNLRGDGPPTRDLVTRRVSRLCDAGLRVVVFSNYVQPLIVRAAIDAGASAFLDKATDSGYFVEIILKAAADQPCMTPSMAGSMLVDARLSPREEEALRCLFQGMDYASIGRRMTKSGGGTVSDKTVKQYVERARLKFAATGRPCKSNTALLARCIEEGRITPQEVEDYRSAAAS
ncbi:response regulator [Nonomuraea typhae]|uniref:Response regulator n=1 Tax=Nonomuraea typhae TaxID=2603600 RepID=A0ABW7YUC8_9ACTN